MNYRLVIYGLLVWGVLFALLQIGFQYHFYYIEQSQLFLFSQAYVEGKLFQVSGVADLLSEYLVQFFIHPYAGAAIVSGLLVAIGMTLWGVLKRIGVAHFRYAWPLIPLLALLFMHLDACYRLQGTVSYLFMLLLLLGYLKVAHPLCRLLLGLVMIPLLFWIGGSISFLFALLLVGFEVVRKNPKWYLSFIGVAEAFMLAVFSVYAAWVGEFRLALLPDLYYHHKLVPPSIIYLSWGVLPCIFLIAFLLERWGAVWKGWKYGGGYLLLFLLIGTLGTWGIPRYGDLKMLKLKELDYYARTGQWEQTIAACQGKLTNYLYVCHLNMALANQGKLLDEMFHYNQMGIEGLIVPWNKQENVSCLLSDVYFTMGAIASSQEMAFEAYVSAMGEGSPRMLKRLVQTNLIYGAYPVAEKYIALLEKSHGYREWASSQRRFLYQEEELLADPLLGGRKQMLPRLNTLTVLMDLADELEHLLENGTGNRASLQYLGAIYLLSKNLEKFKILVEKYYGTEVLPALPVHFQEAVIVLSEKDPDYWKRFGLSEAIVSRFAEYKKQVLANRNNSAVAGLLNRAYGNTYWFYYMFK